VTLPEDPDAPPRVSHPVFRAQSGASVRIKLVDKNNRPGNGATVLRFQQAAFVNPGGQPMKTVPLKEGMNVFRIRSYDDNVCREDQGGCKYDVISDGRQVLDPHVIIWK